MTMAPNISRYCTALQCILPQLPLDELLWRFGRASNLLMANQGKQLMPNPSQASEDQRLNKRAPGYLPLRRPPGTCNDHNLHRYTSASTNDRAVTAMLGREGYIE